MGRQWKRLLNLSVNSTTVISSGSDVSAGLRVRFTIKQQNNQSPGLADITITNLSDATSNALSSTKYAPVILSAGYIDNSGILFNGQVVYTIKGRESPTDKTLQIFAKDSYTGYSSSVTNKAIAKGSTQMDHVNAHLDALKSYGITKGSIPQDLLTKFKYPRGVSLFGMTRDLLDTIAHSTSSHWYFEAGKLNFVPIGGSIPGGPVVLNSTSGLIGMPTQTFEGIMIRCLINPAIKRNSQVKVDQADIVKAQLFQDQAGDIENPQNASLPPIATDGLYTVKEITVSGDTRGQPWYQDLRCIASNVPLTGPASPVLLQFLG